MALPPLSGLQACLCNADSSSGLPSVAARQQQPRMQAALSTKAFLAAPAKVCRTPDIDILGERGGPLTMRCCCSAAASLSPVPS